MIGEDEDPIEVINEALGLQAVVTHKGNEVKCWRPSEDGDVSKTYLSADDCMRLSSAFALVAEQLVPAPTSDEETAEARVVELESALRDCRAEAERHSKTPRAWAPAVIDRANHALKEGAYAPRSAQPSGSDPK